MAVFSIFNIGTGHGKTEHNNIMKRLYDFCADPIDCRYINDGPLGVKEEATGPLNEKKDATLEALEKAINKYPITKVNLTGHSRGGVLCHMIAHEILRNVIYNSITDINIFVIDPVHMNLSGETHEGAEELTSDPRLMSYHAIVMENVNMEIYPLALVRADDETRKKMYYIPMPGTHGSATQVFTNPVAQVAFELIINFMMKKGTNFGNYQKKSPERMCELFANIHLVNPLKVKTVGKPFQQRRIFDDPGDAWEHEEGKHSYQSTKGRADDILQVHMHNFFYAGRRNQLLQIPGKIRFMSLDEIPYFFNLKHATFFSRAFPALFDCVLGQRQFDDSACQNELMKLSNSFPLRQTYHLLAPFIGDPRDFGVGLSIPAA
jgi:hypothetical protein